jgi:hypothetical protein
MDLYWPTPSDLPPEKAANMVKTWNEHSQYSAEYVTAADGHRIVLRRRGELRYFDPVRLGEATEPMRRWLPLQEALAASAMYQEKQAKADRSNASATELTKIDPNAGPLELERWLDRLGWALAMCPREGIAAMASWMEEEFRKRLGEHEAFAYLRTYAGMTTFQIAEVLPRFSILSVDAVAAAIDSPEPPAFMAEEAHSHTSTNYFAIPLGIAYPQWMGTAVLSVSNVVAFILKEPRAQPPLDATHRDTWQGWTSAWYQQGQMGWETLRPARTAAFFAWYVDRLNELLDRISSFESTASAVTGEIRPLKQIALIRSVFQLQDLVGRMLITSDPYGRATWAMLALARFDDLGWGFDLISDADRMTELMKRLGDDAEIGNLYGTYGLRVWRKVMEGILKGAAGELIDGNTKIRLADGKTMPSSRYVREYLRAVRNTIHRFTSDTMEDVFGLHAGVLPLDLSQLVALLWLRALIDPAQLIKPFRV